MKMTEYEKFEDFSNLVIDKFPMPERISGNDFAGQHIQNFAFTDTGKFGKRFAAEVAPAAVG